LNGVELGPAAYSGAVQFGCFGEDVEGAVETLGRIGCREDGQGPSLQEDAGVVGGVSGVALGVDCEPGFAVGGEDVPAVEVAVDDEVGLLLG
jgi:hypothetical protein